MNLAFACFVVPPNTPISARLGMARAELGKMLDVGELDALDEDARAHLHALQMFLLECAGDVFELENRERIRVAEARRTWMQRLHNLFARVGQIRTGGIQ